MAKPISAGSVSAFRFPNFSFWFEISPGSISAFDFSCPVVPWPVKSAWLLHRGLPREVRLACEI